MDSDVLSGKLLDLMTLIIIPRMRTLAKIIPTIIAGSICLLQFAVFRVGRVSAKIARPIAGCGLDGNLC